MTFLKHNEQRGKTAMILIWTVMAISTIISVASAVDVFLLLQYADGQELSQTAADISDIVLRVSGYLYIAAYIISAFTFILWFRRAYYNLQVITGNTEYTDGWAAGSWFIPVANLFIPYNIMKELYTKTDQYLFVDDNEDYSDNRLSTNYIGWWWALWIICNVFGRVISKAMDKAETLDGIIISRIFYTGFSLSSIILAFITIIVIRDYTEAEKRIYNIKQNSENLLPEKEDISA